MKKLIFFSSLFLFVFCMTIGITVGFSSPASASGNCGSGRCYICGTGERSCETDAYCTEKVEYPCVIWDPPSVHEKGEYWFAFDGECMDGEELWCPLCFCDCCDIPD